MYTYTLTNLPIRVRGLIDGETIPTFLIIRLKSKHFCLIFTVHLLSICLLPNQLGAGL